MNHVPGLEVLNTQAGVLNTLQRIKVPALTIENLRSSRVM
jgi:hypothetical protein